MTKWIVRGETRTNGFQIAAANGIRESECVAVGAHDSQSALRRILAGRRYTPERLINILPSEVEAAGARRENA